MTSARIAPGATSLVHHVILYRLGAGAVAEANALDARTPGPGWTCFGGPGVGDGTTANPRGLLDDAGWIAAWAPGWGSDRLRAGTGVSLPAGSRIVMQVHYNLLNGSRPDRSRAVLTTVPGDRRADAGRRRRSSPRPSSSRAARARAGRALRPHGRGLRPGRALRRRGSALAPRRPSCPLRQERRRSPVASAVTTCDRTVDRPLTIQSVAGHMHLLGRSIRVDLNPGTARRAAPARDPALELPLAGRRTCSRQPVQVEPGDMLRVTCRHDATLRRGTPRYVLWGEGTTDEMCLGVLQVTPR